MPRAPSIVISKSWLEIACSAAIRAASSPFAVPTAIKAAPPSDMIVRTSAKSKVDQPRDCDHSEMPLYALAKDIVSQSKAVCRFARLSTILEQPVIRITIRVSDCSFSLLIPASAVWIRRAPSKVNGRVTTPIVSALHSFAICATIGAPPVPVPPPMPLVMTPYQHP